LLALVGSPILAASVSGTVNYPDGKPGRGAHVMLIEFVRSTHSDTEGRYRFDDVPPGNYHLQATTPGLGSSVLEITVGEEDVVINLELSVSVHREQIVVTATGSGRGSGEVIHPVQVLDDTAVDQKMQPTLGETLSQEPGTSSTYYGPGASRPVIRGKGGPRIRVLESGLGVGDASVTSPDHAVALDPFGARSIEILRGSATLLYGGAAVGGVVNVIDDRIPEHAPDQAIHGDFRLRGGSVSNERAGSGSLLGGVGQFAGRLNFFGRETDDYEIPGNAVRNDPASPDGTLPNSSIETTGGSLGLSWVGDKSFVGVSGRRFDSNYGIPVVFVEDGRDVSVAIDMQQVRYDLRGGFDTAWGRFKGIRFLAGSNDYEHVEINAATGEAGTRFLVESYEGRVELHHGPGSSFPGVLGVQLGSREMKAQGSEAFLPPSAADGGALFALQEFHQGPMRYEVGLRYERQVVSAKAVCVDGTPCNSDADCSHLAPGENACRFNPDREFNLGSVSGGLAWLPNDRYTVAVLLARSERGPTPEELYSDGPHLATGSFEVGNPELNKEIGLGLELSLRKRTGWVTGEVNLYAQDYSDFIFEEPTGATEDGLPVFAFSQADAVYYGFEVELLFELLHRGSHDFDLELFGDYVRTENTDTHERLPYIPPGRMGLGLVYSGGRWDAAIRGTYVGRKDRAVISDFDVADFTASYTMLDASVGYRFASSRRIAHQILLRGTNLANREARVSASRLRDKVPLPGTDLNLSYRLVF
jgi:iron complex outermembrane receptor protein